MKVALVYDRVNKIGGAERVLEVLHEIFPQAPLYTAVYNPSSAPWAKKFKVIPSFLNKFPLAKSHHEFYPWLTPLAFESFSFDEFDVVISVTSAEAKGIITKPKTLHICYTLTPTHYLWDIEKGEEYRRFGRLAPLIKVFAFSFLSYLRAWDQIASQRPDILLAISKNVQKRIKKYYGRESEVIYPPIDVKKFQIPIRQLADKFQTNSKYFLIVSRLVPYKKVDIAVEAFNRLGLPLKIVGTGSEERRLKKMAKRNIEFLGQLTDKEVLRYYQRCQALIFPGEEDLGLTVLEAQACGKPVIAYREGGALETVLEGKTGEFFYPKTAAALIKVLQDFDISIYQSKDCQRLAEKFSKEKFQNKFKKFVEEEWKRHLKTVIL